MAKRKFFQSNFGGGEYNWRHTERLDEASREEANVVSSLTDEGTHLPVIDIDFGAKLLPSTTPGHYHLYLDQEMSWAKYQRLLRALLAAEIIEQDFYDLAIKHKQTFARVADRDPVVLMECHCGAMVADMEAHAVTHTRAPEHKHMHDIILAGA